MNQFSRLAPKALAMTAVALVTVATAYALSNATLRRIRIATEVVENRMSSDRPVPTWVLRSTKCLASLKVIKVGLIWGGEGSTGLVSCRLPDGSGWSTPSFFNVGGVNFGLQIGVQFLESVVLFMTDQSKDILMRPTFKVGVDLSFAAGPLGEGGGSGVLPNAQVLTYDRAVGLYVGATIEGFVLSHGVKRNREVYGSDIAVRDILSTPGKSGPVEIQEFIDTLDLWAPGA